MVKEKYINFEIAKLLKEKGFDELTYASFSSDGKETYYGYRTVGDDISRPTLQMVVDWLLEVHHYYIQVMLDSWACGGHMGYYVLIQRTDNDFEIMLQDFVDNVFYEKPEYAYNDAIKYILENLI